MYLDPTNLLRMYVDTLITTDLTPSGWKTNFPFQRKTSNYKIVNPFLASPFSSCEASDHGGAQRPSGCCGLDAMVLPLRLLDLEVVVVVMLVQLVMVVLHHLLRPHPQRKKRGLRPTKASSVPRFNHALRSWLMSSAGSPRWTLQFCNFDLIFIIFFQVVNL